MEENNNQRFGAWHLETATPAPAMEPSPKFGAWNLEGVEPRQVDDSSKKFGAWNIPDEEATKPLGKPPVFTPEQIAVIRSIVKEAIEDYKKSMDGQHPNQTLMQ